jgi:drug/metabolite transporter (DMT)-like permease
MIPSFLAAFCFALSAVCGHRASKMVGGTETNFWRLVVATLCLAAWAFAFGGGLGGVALPAFALSGLVGIGLGDVALYAALPRLGSRLTSLLLQCLTTVFAAATEWLWLGTRLTAAELGCGAVILLGVSLALTPAMHRELWRGRMGQGLAFVTVAALFNALGMVLSRKAYEVAALAGENIDGGTAAFQRLAGGLLLAGLLLLVVRRKEVRAHVSQPKLAPADVRDKWRHAWPWVLANGMLGMTLGVTCMQWALKTTPAAIVSPIIAITPLLVIPLAWKFEGERPSARSLIGGVVAVAGAVGLAVVR